MTDLIKTIPTSHIVQGGTGTSNPVFDKILREQLSDEEAATLAELATHNISHGQISIAQQRKMGPDKLMAAQHELGVQPALTGVEVYEDGMALTRKAASRQGAIVHDSDPTGKLSPEQLTHSERMQLALLAPENPRKSR